MKITRLLALSLMVVALLAIAIQATDDDKKASTKTASEIVWHDYEAGWSKAKAENKHMFIDFTATWCTWCKKLDATTFQNPKVVQSLNNDFVAVKVWDNDPDTLNLDGYKITVKDLIKKEFRVRGYPALWFVSPTEESAKIGPISGYVTADQLLGALDIVKNYRYDSTRNERGEKIIKEKDKTKSN